MIVEDELLVAMDLEQLFTSEGFDVLTPVGSVKKALEAIETFEPDVVSLDLNLNGRSSAPIAVELRRRQIPFLILSGNMEGATLNEAFSGAVMVRKPFDPIILMEKLRDIV